jgi:N,N-dimethylformamidase beta subunit-like protein
MRLVAILLTLVCLVTGCEKGAHRAGGSTTAHSEPPSANTTSGTPDPGPTWRIAPKRRGGIAGYANRTSVAPGQTVRLFVSTAALRFTVRAFRMGWYGGALGRLTWTSAPVRGDRQPAAALVSAATQTMAARWRRSLSVATTGWAPGDYLLRLDASNHHQSYIPLTVRAPSAVGRVVLVNAVTTWQAYNRWGCCDLYQGGDGTFYTRSRAVTFDRPYLAGSGSGEFLNRELPAVALAERLGLRLDYVTDVDLAARPHLLDGATAVVSMGHDEYWSPAMRAAILRARDAGTNLAFLGANAIYRRIRFADTGLGPYRLEINYKTAEEDPFYGRNNSEVTANWPDPPAARPESAVLGAQYACFPDIEGRADGVVVDPGNWLFAGTSARRGQHLHGLIGPETDAVQVGYPTPRPIEVLLHSPTQCTGGFPQYADTSYYTAPSGAAVFDAGTIDWVCAVGGSCNGRVPARTHQVVRRMTANLLTAFADGPAGRVHRARDNLARLGIIPP